MKKGQQIYRLCIKSGAFDKQTPSFVVKTGKNQQKINTYFIQSDKQRYNYDLILQKNPQTDILIHCEVSGQLIGTATLKVDSKRAEQPNQTLSVMNSKRQKIATLDCSLKKLQKIIQKPAINVQVIQATYTELEDKQSKQNSQSFIVLKYGDANYQTKAVANTVDLAPVQKQTFQSAESKADRMFVEAWQKIKGQNKFLGITLIDISKALGTQKDYDLMTDKKKKGSIKIAVYKDDPTKQQTDVKINDKNFSKKRIIKTYILQALLKSPSNKKGTVVRLITPEQQFQTNPVFQQSKQLGFNQSFSVNINQNQQLIALLLTKDDIEEEIGRVSIKVANIKNKKQELKLLDGSQKQIGTLYVQFYDQQLDIKQEINGSQVAISEPSKQKQSNVKNVSEKTVQNLNSTASELKSRYASRQSIHDYMAQVNSALQQGLLKVAKERPQNPIKQLGLYLINYKS